ncbi:hypothetical protein BDP81DRAFT_187760 [Colletotrichum phormii]|uniref:Uncharacterized protein n=1 Tax=Colletotrichum phormii TaxID=359342 RepID=A0AAJ0E965_9PEZI|nr:uncharacterized protein BDP81DRAFT_187760 [Colletotrichum phormii]KAK1613512.1 hypothetical protein BDP81DRAFT_187760 [Colletotrichum phormii]
MALTARAKLERCFVEVVLGEWYSAIIQTAETSTCSSRAYLDEWHHARTRNSQYFRSKKK